MSKLVFSIMLLTLGVACSLPPAPEPEPHNPPAPEDVTASKVWVQDAIKKNVVERLDCDRGQAQVNLRAWRLEVAQQDAIAATLVVACNQDPSWGRLVIHDAASGQELAFWRSGGLRRP